MCVGVGGILNREGGLFHNLTAKGGRGGGAY